VTVNGTLELYPLYVAVMVTTLPISDFGTWIVKSLWNQPAGTNTVVGVSVTPAALAVMVTLQPPVGDGPFIQTWPVVAVPPEMEEESNRI
jgi:hypothetical protein